MTALAGEGLLDIGSQRLEYRFVGPRPDEAPTLILLHEGLGCVGLWGRFPGPTRRRKRNGRIRLFAGRLWRVEHDHACRGR